jgi:hypothetical protein
MQKDFFQQYGLSGWIFCSRQDTRCAVLDLSALFNTTRSFSSKICPLAYFTTILGMISCAIAFQANGTTIFLDSLLRSVL